MSLRSLKAMTLGHEPRSFHCRDGRTRPPLHSVEEAAVSPLRREWRKSIQKNEAVLPATPPENAGKGSQGLSELLTRHWPDVQIHCSRPATRASSIGHRFHAETDHLARSTCAMCCTHGHESSFPPSCHQPEGHPDTAFAFALAGQASSISPAPAASSDRKRPVVKRPVGASIRWPLK